MSDIKDLNQRRAEALEIYNALSLVNVPTDYAARVKLDVRYRLALDAYRRAESDYQKALDAMTTDELIAIAK
jgi:hypothetical protein